MSKPVKIVECPRDAMQGINAFIPTKHKIRYLNTLLEVGFHTLDFGSFVSPKAIPQLRDTSEVVRNLNLEKTDTTLLAIVANERGATEASAFDEIKYLGYPFSISETFLSKNINASPEAAFQRLTAIQNICNAHNKSLVVYISMAFGNPYHDPWSIEILNSWLTRLQNENIGIVVLADTVGLASPRNIGDVYTHCSTEFPLIEWGLHLHTSTGQQTAKLDAAYNAGCRRFDTVHNGLGGCPMAGHDLVGNLNTKDLMTFLEGKNEKISVSTDKLKQADAIAENIYRVN